MKKAITKSTNWLTAGLSEEELLAKKAIAIKCENCLSKNVCRWYPNGMGKNLCPEQKDKDIFIQLPCKVGDTVWFETYKKNATVCVGVQPHKVDRIDVICVCDTKNLVETNIREWEFGQNVFLTREEAEKALKERGEVCKNCKHLMFSDCYGECRKAYKGIVNPDDTCEHFERRTKQ